MTDDPTEGLSAMDELIHALAHPAPEPEPPPMRLVMFAPSDDAARCQTRFIDGTQCVHAIGHAGLHEVVTMLPWQ